MKITKNVVILLAAGQGKRMNSATPKQFLLLRGKPVLFYSLDVFQKMESISEIILVTSEEKISYCKTEIVEKYNFSKVTKVIAGGSERYLSVFCGIKEIEDADNILVHDGARPFVTENIVERVLLAMKDSNACIVGVPTKDTIKMVDDSGYVLSTPDRNCIWSIQTPQVFKYNILVEAYSRLMKLERTNVTDDAMVVEQMLGEKIKIIFGDYKNIKITTPEDLQIGRLLLEK